MTQTMYPHVNKWIKKKNNRTGRKRRRLYTVTSNACAKCIRVATGRIGN
jgi:hypothetical protein